MPDNADHSPADARPDGEPDGSPVTDGGPAVVALQETLNRWYPTLPALTVDGEFGPGTRDRVIHFQKAAGLTADGICVCNTWKKLASAVVGIGRTSTVIDP